VIAYCRTLLVVCDLGFSPICMLRRLSDHCSMNTPDTPASAANIAALRLTAQKRIEQIREDADSLEAVAWFLRESDISGRIGMATLLERSAANLRQLVE